MNDAGGCLSGRRTGKPGPRDGLRGAVAAVLSLALAVMLCPMARAYNGTAHERITQAAARLLQEMGPAAFDALGSDDRRATRADELYQMGVKRSDAVWPQSVAEEARLTDDYRDVRLIDVELLGPDQQHTDAIAHNFTCFNHFIDIRKGPGRFDDYDGYSYALGSGSVDQYERAVDEAGLRSLAAVVSMKVDDAIQYWFNDEHVDTKFGSVRRYSYPADKGRYRSAEDELRARFPRATWHGERNRGFPYSVFMPVDNLARFWYGRFASTGDVRCLGPVLHAMQDCTVPHHAAGTAGNWHSRYESDVDKRLRGWLSDPRFRESVEALVRDWSAVDPSPPAAGAWLDRGKTPAVNWPVDQLATWLARRACEAYSTTYGGFNGGYTGIVETASGDLGSKDLARLAVAMSVIVLKKAAQGAAGMRPAVPSPTPEAS